MMLKMEDMMRKGLWLGGWWSGELWSWVRGVGAGDGSYGLVEKGLRRDWGRIF